MDGVPRFIKSGVALEVRDRRPPVPTRKSAGDTGPLPQTPSPRLFKYNPTIANHVADSWKSNLSSIFKPWGVLVAILGVLKRELGCHGSS